MVSTSMETAITKALTLMRMSPALEDYEIYDALARDGIEPRSAARLVEFLPLVYGRIRLAHFGAHFAETFQRILPDGQFSAPRLFSSEPIWNAAVAFARAEVECGAASEDLLAVAKRSCELWTINKILKSGDDPEGAVSEPIYFLWPEDGPDNT